MMLTRLFLLILLSLGGVSAVAQSGELQRIYIQALRAHEQGNDKEFYDLILQAHQLHPYHPGILYQAGIAAALNNKKSDAIRYLKEALLMQSDFHLLVPELNSLKGIPEFEKLKTLKEKISQPVIESDTAFVIDDRTLHAESITPGLSDGEFFISSIHKRKVVRLKNGVASDFTTTGQDGLCAVFGVKVDKKNKTLWVSSSPVPEMKDYDASIPSCVHIYDLETGKLIQKYLPENPELELVLGDLTLSKKGDVFVSDSKGNLIFKVNKERGKLEQFYSSEEFWNLQGITLSDNDDFMFIADYIKGIFRLDLKTFKLIQISKGVDVSLKSIDGMIFYKDGLISIQNGIKPMRLTYYKLNKELDRITAYSILDRAHPAFNEPTNGCLISNTFYYIANSQWSGYDNGKIKSESELQKIIVLKTTLN